ncbi:MAG TPA: helix-turn-helix domain-containing protein [Candidatus Dormibacteraeota bacterium]|jgi:DNA-binding HxlR family transcriptional regulator|nr:helix-turn-helix domain-containing protein [Candidatus Dormibacteraeota bacterium]
MRRTSFAGMQCSVARTLEIVGEWWTILILRDAFCGVRRFDDFQRRSGIARNILTDRLQTLVDSGILERRRYQERPERFEYRLTEKGKDLYPVVIGLLRWGDRWATEGEPGPPVVLTHIPCEHDVTPELACSACHEPVTANSMRWRYSEHVPLEHRLVLAGVVQGSAAG